MDGRSTFLLELRAAAGDAGDEASGEIAERAVDDAEQFIDAVTSWIEARTDD